MTHEQQALWQRIRDFQIDAPGASFPYSTRLARENGWTPVHARRVIAEYRRFAFLAVVAGHGVTPSKAVDEAWHLHLLYTRNYWEEFCPNALGRPLHHHPADGNDSDELKYEGWYEATLASYERLFDETPPADVWPRPDAPAKKARRTWPWLALTSLFLSGCREPLNPLDWHGPPFLFLIATLYLACLTVALTLRWILRGVADGPPAEEWNLHVYEEAYLNEGERLALATALTRMTVAGQIVVDPKTRRVRAVEGMTGDHALERSILRASSGITGAEYATVHRVAKPILDEIGTSLRRQGLWTPSERAATAMFVSFVVATLPVVLGGAKVLVGLERGRPVGFLVLGCIAALTANLFLLQPPKRSRYGDAVLDALRVQKGAARRAARGGDAPPSDIATGVALFGLSTLAGGPHAHLMTAAVPVPSGGSESNDGGSSCGGGSGCGGGGGCGGGCGGCGS